ncbi:hypothetical protein CRG98_008832 [Punica granatum]|uniref:Uncharacterized protein n=1 Tax=Punica granatum TaxID=22663 RepID=A0A2I0KQM6_PUNGR|nr:hypothetical protein CRG98_008832 [Punica granatum]
MSGLLARASFLLRFATSPSLLTCASCKSTGPATPCILSFTLCNFTESAHLCILQIYRACYPVHPFFYALQVHRVCSLVFFANIPGVLARASFLLRFASPLKVSRVSPLGLLTRASYKSTGPAANASFLLRFASSPSPLTRASCKSTGPATPCILSFTLCNFTESAHLCILQIYRACYPVHPFFYALQVHRVCSLVFFANIPGVLARASFLLRFASPLKVSRVSPLGLLTRASYKSTGPAANASFLLRFASSPSPLARASCKSTGPASLCMFSITVRKFAESAHSCFLQICRAISRLHPFFDTSQDRRVRSLVLLANLPGQLVRASFLLRFATSPTHWCFLQIYRACSPVHPFFYALQVRRVRLPVLLTNLSGLLARASFLLRFASSPSPLTGGSCKCAGAASPCILSFTLRKSAESAYSCFLQMRRGCFAVHPFFYGSQVRRVRSLVLIANLRELVACASFYASQFAKSAHSCFLQICRAISPLHPFFDASQVLRVRSLVLLANLPGQLARASFLLCFATSPSPLTGASCKCAGAASPCILSFTLRKSAESAYSCFLQMCRGCYAVHPFFYGSQVRRVRSLMLIANLRELVTCAILLRFASSPSPLTRASCKSAGCARPCILSFTLPKCAESAHWCFLQMCRGCYAVHPFFYGSQVRRVRSLMLIANLRELVTCAILLRFASSPSPLTRASCKSAGCARPCILSFTLPKCAESAHWCFLQIYRVSSPCILSFKLRKFPEFAHSSLLQICQGCFAVHPFFYASQVRKFAESAHSCFLQICRACSPVHPFFYASQACSPMHPFFYALQFHRVYSLVLLANPPGLLPRASFLLRFASPLKVRQVRSLVLLANMPGLHRCASFLLPFASSPSPLTRASCKSVGSARPCILSFTLRKFTESAHSCFFSPSPLNGASCKSAGPAHPFILSLTRRKLVVSAHWCFLENLSSLLTRASFLLRFASSTSQLTRASCKSVGLARPCILSFTLCNFAESAHSFFLQIHRACSPVHPFFYTSQVHRGCSLVLFANIPGLLARASFLLSFGSLLKVSRVSMLILLTRASCKSAEPARQCILSFTLRKFAESAHSCLLQIYGACSSVHLFYYGSQVRRVRSLVVLANLPGLLRRSSFLLRFAGSPSLLTRASCKSAGPVRLCILLRFASSPSPLTRASCKSAGCPRPCILSFRLRKFAESAHWYFLQIYRVSSPCILSFKLRKFAESYSPVHPFFYASEVRRVRSLVLLANLRGLLARASFLLRFPNSPSLLTHASCKYAGPSRPCILSLKLRKFDWSAHSCFLQICRACSLVHPFFYASQHTGASCKSIGPARPRILSFMLCKFDESTYRCFLQICRAWSPVHPSFYASQVHRVRSLVLLANVPGLLRRASFLLRFASSPWLLTRAFCKYNKSARPCILSFTLRKSAETSQVRRVRSLELFLANLPGLLRRASFLLRFTGSPSPLTGASWISTGPAHLCIFSIKVRKFAESAHSCFLQICRAWSPVHPSFYASQVHRVRSLVLLANLSGLLVHASFLLRLTGSPTPLVGASYKFVGPAHSCIHSFTLCNFTESAHSCYLQIYRACSPVHPFFYASQVR